MLKIVGDKNTKEAYVNKSTNKTIEALRERKKTIGTK